LHFSGTFFFVKFPQVRYETIHAAGFRQ
ncbi:MAG: hypothetical protein EORIYHIE_001476, partial [Candidatus Fervidibacter sp.]